MFKKNSALTGENGERLAAAWYRMHGYRIAARNFRTRQGEIDLIVRKENLLVFAEVKTRGENAIAAPAQSVTAAKQRRLILAAKGYLMMHPEDAENFIRFDVVEVMTCESGLPSVKCIENAFTL